MFKDSKDKISKEKRAYPRGTQLQNYRIEIKLIGEPIYQFRVTNVSSKGAVILIKEDSGFLRIIEVGQVVDADFISPNATDPAGIRRVEIKHITKTSKGNNEGHCLVGLSILEKIDHLGE